jgi:hypothetical protein
MALAATAFALATVHFLFRPNWLRAALCTLTGMALLYSHVYGISIWVAINMAVAAVLLTGPNWVAADGKTWIAINGLAGLSFLAWVPAFLSQAHQTIQDFWVSFPTPRFLYSMSVSIAGGAAMLGCLMILVFLSFLPTSISGQQMEQGLARSTTRSVLPRIAFEFGWQQIIILSWGLVPFLIGYAISIAGRPILFDRYLIGSLPALMLLAARGLRVLCFNRLILASALVALMACSFPMLAADLTTQLREDHRAAAARFAAGFQNSDKVILEGTYAGFAYYFRVPVAHEIALGVASNFVNTVITDPWSGRDLVIQDPATANLDWPEARRVWLIFRQKGPHEVALMQRIEVSYQVEQEFHFYNVSVYLYVRKPSLL